MGPVIEWRGGGAVDAEERLILLAERAAWRRRAHAPAGDLLVADLHLGKPAAFRAAGLPVPEAATAHDLARLTTLLRMTGAKRLIILGDLLHARTGRAAEVIDAVPPWRAAHPNLEVLLVRGNHDVSSGDPPASWGFRCAHAPLLDGGLLLAHDLHEAGVRAAAESCPWALPVGGHVHPVVRLEGPIAGAGARRPCFWMNQHGLMLPAFGSFTGGGVVRPRATDRVFVVADRQVVPMPLHP